MPGGRFGPTPSILQIIVPIFHGPTTGLRRRMRDGHMAPLLSAMVIVSRKWQGKPISRNT
jgi:hypothetical protein